MSLAADIHQMVLTTPGVATVYSADPLWLTAVKQVAAKLSPGSQEPPFVVCCEEAADGDKPTLTVRLRIGSDGSVPAPALARSVAGAVRALAAEQNPRAEVKTVVEISTIGI